MNFESGWYMASSGSIDRKYDKAIGIIQTLNHQGLYRNRLNRGVAWCLDNGVFTGKFDLKEWQDKMLKLEEYKDTCFFVVVPDVVGDCLSTLEAFQEYKEHVKGFPIALVSQDGIREHQNKIKWNEFDCIFIGGSDNHKLGSEGGWVLNEAKKRGKWVHVGRVNSASRILKFWQADSWDGTCLSIAPLHTKRLYAAVLQVRSMKKSKGLFDDIHNFIS